VARSWATAGPVVLSWKRTELRPGGLARAVDRSRPRPWIGGYVSDHRSGGAGGARRLLQLAGYPEISRAETAPGWTTWKRCRSSGQTRRSGRSTPEVTRRHFDQCAFSTLPEEHPIGSLRWPLTHLAALVRVETRGAAPRVGRLAPPKRPGLPVPPEAAARPRAGGPRAGQVRPRLDLASRSQVSAEADGAYRSRLPTEVGCGATRSAD
jgi:hypothetical protein